MHEWSIASGIVSTIVDATKYRGSIRLVKVNLEVGEISRVDVDVLRDALKMMLRDEFKDDVEVEIKVEKAAFKCSSCGFIFKLEDVKDVDLESLHLVPEIIVAFLKCPKCFSHDVEVESGKNIYVKKIFIEDV